MMSALISLLLTLRGLARSRAALHLEVLALRQTLTFTLAQPLLLPLNVRLRQWRQARRCPRLQAARQLRHRQARPPCRMFEQAGDRALGRLSGHGGGVGILGLGGLNKPTGAPGQRTHIARPQQCANKWQCSCSETSA